MSEVIETSPIVMVPGLGVSVDAAYIHEVHSEIYLRMAPLFKLNPHKLCVMWCMCYQGWIIFGKMKIKRTVHERRQIQWCGTK